LLRDCWGHHPEFVFTYVCRRSRHEYDEATGERVWREKGKRYPMTKTVLRDRWNELRTTHRIRASATVYYYRQTGNVALTMALTGHKDIKSFLRYLAAFGALDEVRRMMDTHDIIGDLSRIRHADPALPARSPLALPAPVPKRQVSQ